MKIIVVLTVKKHGYYSYGLSIVLGLAWKKFILIIHFIGHGTFDDLETLQQDLQNEGFIVED